MSKVAIIGGGASGLVAAIYASKNNDVTLFEKNSKCGKKILVTGNGRCNYWNEDFDVKYFNSTNKELLDNIITEDNKKEVMKLFDRVGIVPNIVNGYYYPMSNQAVSVQTALLKEVKECGVNILCDKTVADIYFDNKYYIVTDGEKYEFDKIIISTGSYAGIKDKNIISYKILEKFNHKIVKPLPALVKLVSNNFSLKESNGVRCDVSVKLVENDIEIGKEFGQLQITSDGLSGICVYQLSSQVARGLDNKNKEKIYINFIPWIDDFISFMDSRNNKIENRNVSELLDGILNYKLVINLLKISNIKITDNWNNIDLIKKEELKKNLTNFCANIDDTSDFSLAQTCSGGVLLSEINLSTMESLRQKGMFVTGEIIDVDGLCGGYNLGFAWITGMIAGKNV